MTAHSTANDHDTPGIPRDLPVGAFGGCGPVMWGDDLGGDL